MPEMDCTVAFKHEIIEKYFDTVYRVALLQTGNKVWADDVLQEVFLKYIKSNKQFEDEEHIKAWLIRVAINESKSIFLSSWFKKTAPLSEDIVFENPEDSGVYSAVLKLAPKYRIAIHLHYYENLSVKEISEYLKINESTVKSQLMRGRQKLKEILGGREDYEF